MSSERSLSSLSPFSNHGIAGTNSMNNDAGNRGNGFFSSSSDSSFGSRSHPSNNNASRDGAAKANGSTAFASSKKYNPPASTTGAAAGKKCIDREKENKDPRGGAHKKGRSKSLNGVSPGGQFGRGSHRRRAKFLLRSPRGAPMHLSKRISNRINSGTPLKSPVVAMTLKFTPNPQRRVENRTKGRSDRHYRSSLEMIGHENKPASKKTRAESNHHSI